MNTINKVKSLLTSVLFGVVLLVALASPEARASNYTTNISTAGIFTLLSSPAKISQVQIIGGAAGVSGVYLYDSTGTTNYTNIAYIATGSFTTNLVSTYISPFTGTTNTITNRGTFTYTNTVAANTNNAYPFTAYFAQPATMSTYPVSLINTRGVTVRTLTTNTTISINYNQ